MPGDPLASSGPRVLVTAPDENGGQPLVDEVPTTLADALAQLAVAQDTLRAIRGGEVDAFVVSDDDDGRTELERDRLICRTFADLGAQQAQDEEIARLTRAQIVEGLRFTAMVEALHEGVVVQDDRGRVLTANGTASEILGVAVDDLVSDPPTPVLRDVVTAEGSPMPGDQMPGRRALADGKPVLGVVLGFDRGGQRRWLEINSVPLRFPGVTETPVVISSFRDVTARVAADEAIRFQALLLDTAGQAIIAVDHDGVALYWNRFAEQMYGWTADEAVGRRVVDLILPEVTADLERELVDELAPGDVDGREHWVRRRDGTLFPVFATTTAAVDDHGTTVAYISVSNDITDRRRAERLAEETRQELTAARHAAELEVIERDEAIRANRAKSEFLSRMSHELRTPLNAVLGFGQMLLLDDLTDDQRENLEFICSAGNHLLDLINDVLDISRIEAGALMLSLEPVLLDDVVAQALSLVRPQAAQAGISLPAGLENCGSVHVHSDRQRLLQVLLNLLSNAVKYNQAGGRIEVMCQVSGGTVSIAVTDTGIGMSEADLAKLFTPFERLGAQDTTIEGTGVGLALSRVLSQQMGGSLTVSSEVGVGSTFTLELPAGERSDDQALDDGSSSPDPTSSSTPLTVLAIEDNVVNIRLLERVMARCENVSLLTAIQGRRGIEIATEHQPDLILLDLNLPDLAGEIVLQHLRAEPSTATIPIVICSADASPNQSRRLLDRGASAYLTKPIQLAELFAIIEHVRVGLPLAADSIASTVET